jgi:DNA-binding CsgD family transcriptional regulator
MPAMLDGGPGADPLKSGQGLAPFQGELRELGLENMLMHGSERLPGGATFFVMFGLPHRPRSRHAYFLQLLLPYLHMSLQRINRQQAQAQAGALARPVSAREAEILHWVREGKSNEEIGLILGISGLTVKNHLQRLYRLLGVSNRAQATARGMALHLFDRPPQPLARAAYKSFRRHPECLGGRQAGRGLSSRWPRAVGADPHRSPGATRYIAGAAGAGL